MTTEDREFKSGLTSGAVKIMDEKDLEIQRLKGLIEKSVVVIEDLMPGAANIVCNIGQLNDYLIEANKEIPK